MKFSNFKYHDLEIMSFYAFPNTIKAKRTKIENNEQEITEQTCVLFKGVFVCMEI